MSKPLFSGHRCLWVAAAVLLAAGPARAHRIDAEAKVAGDRVAVEAFYDDDSPAVNARVTVLDGAGQPVGEGRTDDRGRWEFARPGAGAYRLVVDAGAGHRAEKELRIPTETPAAGPATVSEGPGRAEATRTPWERIALGLILIAAFTGGLWAVRRRPAVSPSPGNFS